MRFSKLSGKEIIDLEHGERMGMVGQSDLVINEHTGSIESIILPASTFLGVKKTREALEIPWHAIRKIGPEMIIVEMRQRQRSRE